MGGCDLNDQMCKVYRSRKHYKSPRRLIIKCLMWCCYNTFVIRRQIVPTTSVNKRKSSFLSFVDDLCMELVGDGGPPLLVDVNVQSRVRSHVYSVTWITSHSVLQRPSVMTDALCARRRKTGFQNLNQAKKILSRKTRQYIVVLVVSFICGLTTTRKLSIGDKISDNSSFLNIICFHKISVW